MTKKVFIFTQISISDDVTIGQVSKRLADSSHKCCFSVALPCGVDSRDTERQTVSLRNSFMNYFSEKKAAGSLVIKSDSTWLVYIFPSCKFVDEHLDEYAPDLKATTSDLPKLLIAIIPKVFSWIILILVRTSGCL